MIAFTQSRFGSCPRRARQLRRAPLRCLKQGRFTPRLGPNFESLPRNTSTITRGVRPPARPTSTAPEPGSFARRFPFSSTLTPAIQRRSEEVERSAPLREFRHSPACSKRGSSAVSPSHGSERELRCRRAYRCSSSAIVSLAWPRCLLAHRSGSAGHVRELSFSYACGASRKRIRQTRQLPDTPYRAGVAITARTQGSLSGTALSVLPLVDLKPLASVPDRAASHDRLAPARRGVPGRPASRRLGWTRRVSAAELADGIVWHTRRANV